MVCVLDQAGHCRLTIPWHMQEYEKRLLAKDHEIKVAEANARELQKRLNQANAELANSSRTVAAEPAPAQGAPTSISAEFL